MLWAAKKVESQRWYHSWFQQGLANNNDASALGPPRPFIIWVRKRWQTMSVTGIVNEIRSSYYCATRVMRQPPNPAQSGSPCSFIGFIGRWRVTIPQHANRLASVNMQKQAKDSPWNYATQQKLRQYAVACFIKCFGSIKKRAVNSNVFTCRPIGSDDFA